MEDRKRSSVTFFAVYPCTVLLGRARRKEQMCGEHKLTTLAREHDLDCLGRPNPGEIDGERFDGCWATERRT